MGIYEHYTEVTKDTWFVFFRYNGNKNSVTFPDYMIPLIYDCIPEFKKSIKAGLKEFKGIPIDQTTNMPALMQGRSAAINSWKPKKKVTPFQLEHKFDGIFEIVYPEVRNASSRLLYVVPSKLMQDFNENDRVTIYFENGKPFEVQPYICMTKAQWDLVYPHIKELAGAFEKHEEYFYDQPMIYPDFDTPLLESVLSELEVH